MRRAVIYARYSTEHQSDKSIDDQVALCRRHAEREGLRVAQVYSDRARSSATLHGRRGIADLLDDARGGAFDVVIVESLDRISRDQADLATVYKRLAFQGIDIVTVNEGRANDLLLGLRGLHGHGPKAIAGALNRDGALPPRGTKWNASTINGSPKPGYGLLSNPLYDGRQVWNRVGIVRDPDTGRRVSHDKPIDEWMEEPAEHLRIVPAEVFAAVQARRKEQSIRKAEGRPIKRAVRPFSGSLRCALCGKGMAVHDRRGTAIRIKCATAVESGTCEHTGSARLDRIESAILGHLGETLADRAYLEAYVAAYQNERARVAGGPSCDIPAMERELAKARADHGRMVDLVVRGVVEGSDAEDRSRTLKQEVKDAEAARADAVSDDVTIEVAPDAHERFARSIGALSERLRDPDPIFDRDAMEVLRHLIDHIVVHPKSEDGLNQIEVEGDLSTLIAPIRGGWGV